MELQGLCGIRHFIYIFHGEDVLQSLECIWQEGNIFLTQFSKALLLKELQDPRLSCEDQE